MGRPTLAQVAAATERGKVEDAALERATDIFRALSNPLRVGIIRELAGGGRAVHELVTTLDIAQPRVSEHLAVLRAARLVEAERHGRSVTYRLVDKHVAHIVDDAVIHAGEISTPTATSA